MFFPGMFAIPVPTVAFNHGRMRMVNRKQGPQWPRRRSERTWKATSQLLGGISQMAVGLVVKGPRSVGLTKVKWTKHIVNFVGVNV